MSRYGQYHNIDNILRQSDELCRSPPHLCYSGPIGDPLTLYGHYPFEWINECPYIIDLYGLHFRLYGSKPLIRVRPLHGIHVSDQILVVLIEFNKFMSRT